jgi:Cu-Zn family superoxide dismutase
MQPVRLSLAAFIALAACSGYSTARPERAEVPMRDASGRNIGTLTVTNTPGGLSLTGVVSGLRPGPHGIHFHAIGRCDAPTFESAGPHWNPTHRLHGTLNPQGPHLADMPNLVVVEDGSATVSLLTPGGTLRGADPLLDSDGATVIIHANEDDYRTDPSGNSGSRIACGVVRGI